jgi:hypothetical protein
MATAAIQLSLEACSHQYESFVELDLLSEGEVEKIKARRLQLELTMRRPSPSLSLLKQALEWESDLEELVRRRAHKAGVPRSTYARGYRVFADRKRTLLRLAGSRADAARRQAILRLTLQYTPDKTHRSRILAKALSRTPRSVDAWEAALAEALPARLLRDVLPQYAEQRERAVKAQQSARDTDSDSDDSEDDDEVGWIGGARALVAQATGLLPREVRLWLLALRIELIARQQLLETLGTSEIPPSVATGVVARAVLPAARDELLVQESGEAAGAGERRWATFLIAAVPIVDAEDPSEELVDDLEAQLVDFLHVDVRIGHLLAERDVTQSDAVETLTRAVRSSRSPATAASHAIAGLQWRLALDAQHPSPDAYVPTSSEQATLRTLSSTLLAAVGQDDATPDLLAAAVRHGAIDVADALTLAPRVPELHQAACERAAASSPIDAALAVSRAREAVPWPARLAFDVLAMHQVYDSTQGASGGEEVARLVREAARGSRALVTLSREEQLTLARYLTSLDALLAREPDAAHRVRLTRLVLEGPARHCSSELLWSLINAAAQGSTKVVRSLARAYIEGKPRAAVRWVRVLQAEPSAKERARLLREARAVVKPEELEAALSVVRRRSDKP